MDAGNKVPMATRSLIADEHVHDAHRRGRTWIEVMPGDIVTAQAKETADRLNILLRDGPVEKPVVVKTDGATAMRRGLFRRHPGWLAPRKTPNEKARKIGRLALVGAGGVGMNIAHIAANTGLAEEVTLIDMIPGVAEAIALDLSHGAGIHRQNCRFNGGTSMGLVADADVVVVTAGRPRTPGMTRSDLFQINGRVIRSIGETIANLAANAVVIVMSNPLDEMTHVMLEATGFPRERVMGMAGTLDSARFRANLARAAGVAVADVEAITLGSHGDEMVPVVSRARIRGHTLDRYLSREQIDICVEQTIHGGAQIVALKKTGSATLAPAYAVIEMLDHIRGARAGSVPVSIAVDGEYGITETVLGVPCTLGQQGLIAVNELSLSESELQAMQTAAESVRQRLESVK